MNGCVPAGVPVGSESNAVRGVRFPPIANVALIEQTRAVARGDYSRESADRRLVAVGATLAGLAVTLGAFGAHALKGQIGQEALRWWQTAVEYQMWHALAVLGLGLSGTPRLRLSGWLFAGGALVFSGTLYALALGAPGWLGAGTPLGGVAMICGWAILAWRVRREIE